MDVAAIVQLIEALKGKNFYDLWKALLGSTFKELPPGRWTAEIDGQKLGHVVTSHHVGLDEVDGAWATWAWTQGGQARAVHLSQLPPSALLVTVDGNDEDDPAVVVTTGDEGQFPHVFLIVHVKFSDASGKHDYRFAGRMQ